MAKTFLCTSASSVVQEDVQIPFEKKSTSIKSLSVPILNQIKDPTKMRCVCAITQFNLTANLKCKTHFSPEQVTNTEVLSNEPISETIGPSGYLLATEIILRWLTKAQCLTLQCSRRLCDQILLALVLYRTRIEVLLVQLLDHSLQAFLQNVYTHILPFFFKDLSQYFVQTYQVFQ